jgi:hypothetical protein
MYRNCCFIVSVIMATSNFGGSFKETADIHTMTGEHQANIDTQSLEERNEREILEHPDEITQKAQVGVQKAEATALVWSRPALYATYAW